MCYVKKGQIQEFSLTFSNIGDTWISWLVFRCMWHHLFPTNVEERGDKQKNWNLSRKITKTVLTSAEDCVFVKDSIRHSTILTWHVSFMFLCTYYFVNSVWPPHSSAILCLYVTWILLNLFHLCDCVLPLPTMSGDSRHYWNKKSCVKITVRQWRGGNCGPWKWSRIVRGEATQ